LDPDTAQSYSERARVYCDKGEHERAIADYDEAARLDPKRPVTYANRGLARYYRGEYDLAIADYSEAIRLDPKMGVAYGNRGLAHHYKGDYASAIADYDDAIRLDPANGTTYYNRARAHVHNGARSSAKADYRQALRLGLSGSTKASAEAELAELEKSRLGRALDRAAKVAATLAGGACLIVAIPAALFVGYLVWNFDGIWNIPHHSNKFAVYCLIFLPAFTFIGLMMGAFKLFGVNPAQGDAGRSSPSD
jgi:tetratricopeptide (TPR) repeat protein